ncbi:MAG TPA: YbbR-like domain-containing protein [Planctomycetota bacterium]
MLRFFSVLVLGDVWLKLTCLLLAVLMWFYIDGELTDLGDFTVSMRPADVQVPANWELAADQPLPKFVVRLRGPRRRLGLLISENILFRKQSVTSPQPGRNAVTIKPADLVVQGFEVLNVTPKDEKGAAVYLVTSAKQLKRVRVKTSGRVKAKYVAEPATADPDQVSIEGPVDDLDKIEYVWTEDVDLADADQDIVREVGIVPYSDVSGKQIAFRCATTAKVTVRVHPERVARKMTLDVRPIAISGGSLSVEPKSVEVEVQAEEQDFAAAEFASSILLFVEWPRAWGAPKDAVTVLGPLAVQVKAAPPPRVEVHGANGGPLPTVTVRGALCGQLGK